MTKHYAITLIIFLVQSFFPQEVIFEKSYSELPFPVRIENSGIYSIASFDVNNSLVSFSSFDEKGVFTYADGKFKLSNPHQKAGEDFYVEESTIAGSSESIVRKIFHNGIHTLFEKDGVYISKTGEKLTVSVPNRSELLITSNIPGASFTLKKTFPNDLACAEFIGIDKLGNLFVEIEKYISEVPLKIRREVIVFSKSGNPISILALSSIKYLYTLKDLSIDPDGNLYHLITFHNKVQIVKWSGLTNYNPSVITYPPQYNQDIHYNNIVPTSEIETKVTGEENVLIGTSRRDALRIGDTYVLHQFVCNPVNLAPNGITAPDGDIVRTPSWLIEGTNARIPYKWGGFSTLAQFDAGLAAGKYAGDTHTSGVSSYAYGVDCSGFVSRCWKLTYHASTSYMPNITTQYPSWDDLKPGDAIHKVGHVRLFIKRNVNGSFKIVEAASRNWAVSYWSFSASDLTAYTPRYYNNMEVNYNSQIPVLLSVEALTQNEAELNWDCDSTNIVGYRVYGSQDGENWSLLLNENECTTTYALLTLTGSIKYFRISSVKNDPPDYSESYWSNVLGSTFSSSEKKALIVDGFEREMGSWQATGNSFVTKYGNAVHLNSIPFVSIKNSQLLDGSFSLTDFDYVFWILGDESTADETFNSAEQQLIKNYLEAGGNMFVSGSEIGWDLYYNGTAEDKHFYNNYLMADFVSDDAQSLSVVGVDSLSLADCSFSIGQTYDEEYPDEINSINGSLICIRYSNNKGAGIQYCGYFNNSNNLSKIIHLAFPLETTADESSFNSVILKAIYYFNNAVSSAGEETITINSFNLSQNYPNPFNPVTKIAYQLPTAGHIYLKIFDVLGNEISTLVDEYRNAGRYEVTFDASSLPSGVYFYQLTAGSFKTVRKMNLIK